MSCKLLGSYISFRMNDLSISATNSPYLQYVQYMSTRTRTQNANETTKKKCSKQTCTVICHHVQCLQHSLSEDNPSRCTVASRFGGGPQRYNNNINIKLDSIGVLGYIFSQSLKCECQARGPDI